MPSSAPGWPIACSRPNARSTRFCSQLADAGRLDQLTQYDRLRAKIDLLIARIRGAWQGYSGIFDLVKIDEARLDRIYEHDLAMMQLVEEFSESFRRLGGAPASGPGGLNPPPVGATAMAAGGSTAGTEANPAAANPAAASPLGASPLGVSPLGASPLGAANAAGAPSATLPAAPAGPPDPVALLPRLTEQLDAIGVQCDQRADLLKGLE